MATDAHAALVAALDSGRPFGTDDVERIDTHAAHVFLTGDRAFKIKRPVAFSVLDFTTLEARQSALEAELRLNRRTAPDLYVRVLPVTRDDGGFALDGDGEVVEWMLEMKRFPQAAQLDRIAAEGPLDPALAEELGTFIAAFHEETQSRPDMGGHDAMREVVRGNRTDLEAAARGLFAPARIATVDAAAHAALDRLGEQLDARRAGGFVRHCHGDLHLANIVALESGVVPFDCIEFSEEIACIDTMYDLAFLLMDLVDRGQRPAAWQVQDAYLERSNDVAGLRLLPFFMALRATIRAKVTGFAVADPSDPEAEAPRRYLALAEALEPAPAPMLLAIGGFSGTGKTTLARRLAPLVRPVPGAVLIRSDLERKRLAGVASTDTLPADAYTPDMHARTYAHVRRRAKQVLAAGMSVVVDAVHEEPRDRDAVVRLAAEMGAPFAGLWLEAPPATLVDRVGARARDASDADEAVVRAQLAHDPGTIAWPRLDAAGSPPTVAREAADMLGLDVTALAR